MARFTTATMIVLALFAQPSDAVTRSAVTRAALNSAGEDRRVAAAVRPAASLVELAADASGTISSPLSHGISAHERAAMRRLTAKMAGSVRDASHAAPPAPAATITQEQPAAATTDQPVSGTSATPAVNASTAELAAGVASVDDPEVAAIAPEVAIAEASVPTAEATEVTVAEVAPAADSPQSAADSESNATSMEATSAEDAPVTEDVLSSIDKDLLAALTNASSVLTNASQTADLMNASTFPDSQPSDDAAERAAGGNASWAAWPGPLEPAGSAPTNSTETVGHSADIGVPPSPLDPLPDIAGQVESNATNGPLDGELGRLIGDLHNRIDTGVVPAAVKAETKSSEYTKSLEELRDSIVSFKQGVGHFEDRAKAKHRAVMRRVQQALDAQRSAPAASPNSTSAGAIPALPGTPAQSESAAPPSPASQATSPLLPSSPTPSPPPSPPLA